MHFGQENAPNPARMGRKMHFGQGNAPNPARKLFGSVEKEGEL